MAKCRSCDHLNSAGSERCQNCGAWMTSEGETPLDEHNQAGLEDRVRSLLNQGQKIEAIKVYREATGDDLAEAKAAVEGIEGGQPPPANFEEEVRSLLERGQKIEAIKRYRENTGVGLKEAKDAVEAIAARYQIKSAGCAGMIALILMIVTLLVAVT